MNEHNIEYVELGFINKYKKYKNTEVGFSRNLQTKNINYYNYIGKGYSKTYKKVVMGDFNNINMNLLTGKNKLQVDLIRIAFHKNNLIEGLQVCKKIKDLGYTNI